MTPTFAAPRVREVPDEPIDVATVLLEEIIRQMSLPGPGMGDRRPPTEHALRITLRDGFRGHAVVVTVDGREIYRRNEVSTDPASSRADVVELQVASHVVQVVVSASPGDYAGSLDLDVSAHPYLAISLIGEGTVSFETSFHGFT